MHNVLHKILGSMQNIHRTLTNTSPSSDTLAWDTQEVEEVHNLGAFAEMAQSAL